MRHGDASEPKVPARVETSGKNKTVTEEDTSHNGEQEIMGSHDDHTLITHFD